MVCRFCGGKIRQRQTGISGRSPNIRWTDDDAPEVSYDVCAVPGYPLHDRSKGGSYPRPFQAHEPESEIVPYIRKVLNEV